MLAVGLQLIRVLWRWFGQVQSDAGFKEPGGGAAAVTGRGAADRF